MMRILIVDDDPDWRAVLKERLRVRGHEVLEAASGLQALASMGERPDLILLDHSMPGMTGEELAQRLPDGAPPVVFLTASGPGEIHLALSSGPHYYLPKEAGDGELSLLLGALGA